jgi:4-hydroxy-2-oxoheptanedioate aldolase
LTPGVLPIVRVPWNEPGIIGKVLDAGAYGVICPMINTEAEARALVQYSKYPPHGTRSNGPIRAGVYGEAGGYQKTANDEILVIPMIETKTALDNLEAISRRAGDRCDLCRPFGPRPLARHVGDPRPGGAGDPQDL